jgi:uncharacterized protein YceK
MRQLLMVSSLLVLLSGCSSIRETFDVNARQGGYGFHRNKIYGVYKNKIYVGVRNDFKTVAHPYYLIHLFVALIDLPLSLISDTVLSPYAIPVTIDNLSEKNVVDPVCFLLNDLRYRQLLSKEGKKEPDIFLESEPCRIASPWGEDETEVRHAVIPTARPDAVARFYDQILPFVSMVRTSRSLGASTTISYWHSAPGIIDVTGGNFITLTREPGERQIYEPFLLWAMNEDKAKAMKALIPQAGGAITREEYSLSGYWPNLEAFEFTDPIDTKFRVVYRAKGPSTRWVDQKD